MKTILPIVKKLQDLSSVQGGVFTLADLKNLFNPGNKDVFYRILKQMENAEMITPFCRGFYITEDFNMQILSQKLCADSYISFESVLSENLIIGPVPTFRLRAVKLGPTRKYQNLTYKIEQYGITKNLFMGFENVKGVKKATPEKAFLDILYYYQKGMRFNFDIYSDIDYSAFDNKKVNGYLEFYKNKKFVSFVKGVLNG